MMVCVSPSGSLPASASTAGSWILATETGLWRLPSQARWARAYSVKVGSPTDANSTTPVRNGL